MEAAPAVDAEALRAEITAAEAEADDLSRQAANAKRSGNPATKAQGVEIRQRADAQRARAKELREAADGAGARGASRRNS